MLKELVVQRHLNHGFKHFEGDWYYKKLENWDIHDIRHLCHEVGFAGLNKDKCTSCGENMPFALKIYGIKYA